jgi:hypothetical protein
VFGSCCSAKCASVVRLLCSRVEGACASKMLHVDRTNLLLRTTVQQLAQCSEQITFKVALVFVRVDQECREGWGCCQYLLTNDLDTQAHECCCPCPGFAACALTMSPLLIGSTFNPAVPCWCHQCTVDFTVLAVSVASASH